jgi:hypothetical protein
MWRQLKIVFSFVLALQAGAYEYQQSCCVAVSAPPYTKRFVVFKLENLDFVEKFAEL